ncbi:MAG: hypothetical protein K2Y26_05575 [Gemmatimonadaceae bacterium]|jgi:aryl carrier-like protein|nr:hypothetical protein [Gemmatimonadaceae bacterium]
MLSKRRLPPPGLEKRRVAWPPATLKTAAQVQWRVWIAEQVRFWRRGSDSTVRVGQKQVQAVSGLPPDVLTGIENGTRGLDVVELMGIAAALGRKHADIGALFEPPTTVQWQQVCARRLPVQATGTMTQVLADRIDARLRGPFASVPRYVRTAKPRPKVASPDAEQGERG